MRVTVRFGPVRFESGRVGSGQPTYLGAGEQRRHVRRAVPEGRTARGVLALVLLGLRAPLALAPSTLRTTRTARGLSGTRLVVALSKRATTTKKKCFSFFLLLLLSLSHRPSAGQPPLSVRTLTYLAKFDARHK